MQFEFDVLLKHKPEALLIFLMEVMQLVEMDLYKQMQQ